MSSPVSIRLPQFSVVIPTCDRTEALAECLRRLAPGQQNLPADRYEVVVTDDGVKQGAEAMLGASFPRVRWVTGPKRGPAANRNHGASIARGDWLAFTDDDCLPDPQWLAAFAAVIDDSDDAIDVLEGHTYVRGPKLHPHDDSPVNEAGGNLWACNFAIRRNLFVAIGGFDERFRYPTMEDVEFRIRLTRQGTAVEFVPRATVLHPWRRIIDWRKHQAQQIESRRQLEELYPGEGAPRLHWRILWHYGKVIATEHIPFALRRPIEGIRILPPMWWSFAQECIWRMQFRRRIFRGRGASLDDAGPNRQ